MKTRAISLKNHRTEGFTLIELMIVIAIVGILAAVAAPQYSQYVNRAKFSELVVASSSVKKVIEACYQLSSGADACNMSATSQTITGQVTDQILLRASNATLVGSIALTGTTTPIIEVTATSTDNMNGKTYVLTGIAVGTAGVDRVITAWEASGTGCEEGWC